MKHCLIMVIALLATGCVWKVEDDLPMWLEVKMVDEAMQPVSKVQVSWGNMILYSNESGCFFLGGAYPEAPLDIRLDHRDFKTARLENDFGSYRARVILAGKDGNQQAQIDWEPVSFDLPPGCSGPG